MTRLRNEPVTTQPTQTQQPNEWDVLWIACRLALTGDYDAWIIRRLLRLVHTT